MEHQVNWYLKLLHHTNTIGDKKFEILFYPDDTACYLIVIVSCNLILTLICFTQGRWFKQKANYILSMSVG